MTNKADRDRVLGMVGAITGDKTKTRASIVAVLADNSPLSSDELRSGVGKRLHKTISEGKLDWHLKDLQAAGVVKIEDKEGHSYLYDLTDEGAVVVEGLRKLLID